MRIKIVNSNPMYAHEEIKHLIGYDFETYNPHVWLDKVTADKMNDLEKALIKVKNEIIAVNKSEYIVLDSSK